MTSAGSAASAPAAATGRTARRGFVHVYTGEGKGKTTAAMGLALRAVGHDRRVFIGQFMKGRASGEIRALGANPLVRIEQYGDPGFLRGDHETDAHVARARDGFARARESLRGGEYDVVILDEIDVAIWYDLLTHRQCLALLEERPAHVELVLTGRWAPQALLDRADLVTEMREVKHYYRRGVSAREGIEF